MSYNSFRNDNNGAGEFALIQFRKSNNFASVAALDLLGQVLWSGYDAGTSTYKSASFIYCQAVGAPAGNIPSELQFNTSFGTGTQLAMTIGQNGQVSISNPAANETTMVVVNDQTSPNINLRTANATATNSPHVHFTRSRAGTADVQASDDLGRLEFRGFQGGTAIEAADIRAQAETVNGASVSGSLQFRTRPTTYAAVATRMNISADGNVTINSPLSSASLTINDPVTSTQVVRVISSKTSAIDVETTAGASLRVIKTSNDVNPPDIYTLKRRTGGTISVGDIITRVIGYGQTANTDQQAGYILMNAEKVNSGPNFVSGHWYFATTDLNGANGNRLEIAANGNVTIAAPTSGTALTIVGGGETITSGNLSLTAGNINLSTTSATSGIVNVNSTRFMHAYGTNNTFLGSSAGNFTLTATQTTAIGASAGNNISTGGNCVYIGYQAGNTVSGGNENTVIGSQAFANANASQNVVIGYQAGNASTGFTACTVVGKFALNNTNTGLYNLMLGYGSGTNFTGAESSNICLHSDGVLGDSNTLRIGQSSGAGNRQLNKAFICGIDGVNVGSVAKVITMASDQLGTATITAGAGISVTPTANTITIATTNGIAWTEVTGTSQSMAVDSGYIANNAGLVTLTLPATAAVGDRVRIAGKGAGGWRCGQNAGQTINFGNTATTAGVGGYIDSTNRYDALELLCITANTTWVTLSSVGNLNVV